MSNDFEQTSEGKASSPPPSSNRFQRHATLTRIVLLVLAIGFVEAVSYAAVHIPGFYKVHNRVPSGYYVFRNNPEKDNNTWLRLPNDQRVRVDEHGFVAARPVTRDKPDDVTRIFVMGGSTAFGTVQNSTYRELHEYPRGMYTHRDSIAGRLQAVLEERRPDRRFEVITAASVSRTLHQSLTYYLETVSRFSPDWVVSVDGFNDINHVQSGTPYADREKELRFYIDIQNTADCRERPVPNTFCLVEGLYNRFLTELTRGRRRPLPEFTKPFVLDSHTEEHYVERKPEFLAGARRMVQTAGHMGAVLKADDVRQVFVLQPMLHRARDHKGLSETENLLANDISPPLYSSLPDTLTTTPVEYLDSMLILKYLFDDHLSAALERQVEIGGHLFIDMNQELQDVPESVEIFTDYCHLTIEGNRLVAEAIAEAILSAQTGR